MANTQITLTLNDGVLVPSQSSVPVASGDTVAFRTADGSAAYLFFSPDATGALSPTPSSPAEVSASGAEFTFTTSAPGAYAVFFETSATAPTTPFPVVPSTQLVLEVDDTGLSFGDNDNKTHR